MKKQLFLKISFSAFSKKWVHNFTSFLRSFFKAMNNVVLSFFKSLLKKLFKAFSKFISKLPSNKKVANATAPTHLIKVKALHVLLTLSISTPITDACLQPQDGNIILGCKVNY